MNLTIEMIDYYIQFVTKKVHDKSHFFSAKTLKHFIQKYRISVAKAFKS